MSLLICYSCGRTRSVEKANGKAFNCGNCGAHGIKATSKKPKWWRDDGEKDGEERRAARAQTYQGLAWIAQQKGYKPGWVAWRFKKAYRSWPNGEKGLEAAAPGSELMRWLKRDNVAYAKRMRAEEAKAEIVVEKKPEEDSGLMTAEDYEVKW